MVDLGDCLAFQLATDGNSTNSKELVEDPIQKFFEEDTSFYECKLIEEICLGEL